MASSVAEIYYLIIPAAVCYAFIWFLFSLIAKRNDVADIAWGLGYVFLCIFFILFQELQTLNLLVYALVILWGLRLSIHIAWRNSKKSEDFRYKQWRDEWGSYFYIRSFLQVYLLQVFILIGISTPIIIATQYASDQLTVWTVFGVLCWCLGFYWQARGDYQLLQFKKNNKGSGQIISSGLWRYSRHPNYFGEICMWWGIGIIVLPIPFGWVGLFGPVLVTFLLLKVSGVPMLEAKYRNHEGFQAYAKNTPAVFPKLQHLLKK